MGQNQNVSQGKVSLDGFEDALIAHLASKFRFASAYLSNVVLKVGRHLFAQDMRSTDELVADARALGEDYDPEQEPTVSVFTAATSGIAPTISRGGRHEWQLRVAMRHTATMEECKARLEELAEYFEKDLPGAYISGYAVKGVVMTVRPNVFQLEDSEQAYCEATFRLFAVPRVTS